MNHPKNFKAAPPWPFQPGGRNWRLYAKLPGQKRFSPLDYSRGVQVVNLIHATLFSDAEKAEVSRTDLPLNPTVSFEWRHVGQGGGL